MGFNTFPCNPYPISTEELNKGNNDDLNTRVAALENDVSDLNSTKANQITIAPFFNAETAYTAGDLVYYNGLSYRCTNDHEGEWDADDFASTTVANELDSLKSGLTSVENALTGCVKVTVTHIVGGGSTATIALDRTKLTNIELISLNTAAVYNYYNLAIEYNNDHGWLIGELVKVEKDTPAVTLAFSTSGDNLVITNNGEWGTDFITKIAVVGA